MGTRARATSRKPRGPAIVIRDDADGNIKPLEFAGDPETGGSVDPGIEQLSGSIVDPGSVGNPGGSGNSGTGNIDPATGKRRYRARRTAKAADPVSLSEITGWKDIALSAHAMLHGLTKNPLFDIDESDAERITLLSANVARHYENIPGVSAKTKDWILFIQGAAAIYAPRFMVWQMQRAEAKRNRQPVPQSPHAPRNVAPSPTAANVQQPEASQASPGVSQRTMPPANTMPGPNNPRNQPGLNGLDGADLPIKLQ